MRDLKYLTPSHDVLSYGAADGRIVIVDLGGPGWAEAVAADPAPYAPPELVSPTLDDYRLAVQSHIDATARARLYDSGVSLASYVGDPNPQWAAEAATFVNWRSAVWQQVYVMWASPPDPLPTSAELLALLPEITWPEEV